MMARGISRDGMRWIPYAVCMPAYQLDDADRGAAEALLQAIHKADDGYYTASPFDRLFGAAHVTRFVAEANRFPYGHLVAATEHFRHLTTLVYKVAWLAERRAAAELDDITWMYFCGSDILTFHIVMRSLFDEVSAIAAQVAMKKGVVPDTSFHRLRKWVDENTRSDTVLGSRLAEAIRSCDWFDELRDVRGDLVHHSAQTLVFLEPGRVLFQVHVGPSPKILIPSVMFNDDVVDFTTYSALLMARLATFLDRFAEAVFVVAPYFDEEKEGSTQSVNPGLGVLQTWLQALLAETP
jgi:hypothetical protein